MNIVAQLGPMHAASLVTDPKHIGFVSERYKFAAKMLHGARRVLEVGCGDTTFARTVKCHVVELEGIDIDHALMSSNPTISVHHHDILERPFMPKEGLWDGVYALDVLEHIRPQDEDRFFENICRSLHPHGTVVIGTPSLESQPHASELSRRFHVNCKTEDGLRTTMRRHFHCVYIFSMNDCAIHLGHPAMAHYRLAVATGQKQCLA